MTRRSKEIPACVLLLAAATSVGCQEDHSAVDANGHMALDSHRDIAHAGGSLARIREEGNGGVVQRAGFGTTITALLAVGIITVISASAGE